MKEELFTSLLIAAMIIAAALYTNPPNVRCTLEENNTVCIPISN